MPAHSTHLFIGDSITDSGRDRTDPHSLGDGYVQLIAQSLDARGEYAEVINVGIAGDRAIDLEQRWAADVDPREFHTLTVYVGVNDMWRRYDQDDPTSVDAFEATYRRLLARLARHPDRLILIEPYLVPIDEAQRGWLEDLDPKRAVVRRLADESDAVFVPLHDAKNAAADQASHAAIAPDGVHPTPVGSAIIADAWLTAHDTIVQH